MAEWMRSLFLGVIQGLSEFLPISSDGHLALFQILTSGVLGDEGESGAYQIFFDVMLHLGTTVAILITYRLAIRSIARGLLGDTNVPEGFRRDELIRMGWLVFVATLPLVPVALIFKGWIEQTFQSLVAVGVGFLVTACVLLLTLRMRPGEKGPRTMVWQDALLIGLAQAVAPLPGVSRSGFTVAMALARGFSRSWAVGFSLLIAVPAILGAAVFELRHAHTFNLSANQILQLIAATAVSGVVGYWAIFWLVRVVRAQRLWMFSVYLLFLAAMILGLLVPRSSGLNESNTPTHAVVQPAS